MAQRKVLPGLIQRGRKSPPGFGAWVAESAARDRLLARRSARRLVLADRVRSHRLKSAHTLLAERGMATRVCLSAARARHARTTPHNEGTAMNAAATGVRAGIAIEL